MTHRMLLVVLASVSTSAATYAQDRVVPFDAEHWHLAGNAEIVEFAGRTAFAGMGYVKDVEFLNGTIDVDLWTTGARNYGGIMFRVQSFDEYEWCWIRTHKSNGLVADGIQYAPAFLGTVCWQWNGGPSAMRPVNVPKNQWVHMRITVLNDTAWLYVGDMSQPAILMDDLQIGPKKGSVGLSSNPGGNVYFSNFEYQIDEESKVEPPKKRPFAPGVVTGWQLSPDYKVKSFNELGGYPAARLAEIHEWTTPEVAPSGFVNISKYRPHTSGSPDCVILKTTIDSESERCVKMHFGYSDAVAIFLNGRPLFWGNSAWRSRNMAFGGWVNYNDAVYLNLAKGRNELVAVVGEVFGGSGFQAKLDDTAPIAPTPSGDADGS